MKTIRLILPVILFLLIVNPVSSQIDLLKKVKKKSEQKTDEAVDSELDKLFGKKKKKDKTATSGDATVQPATMETEVPSTAKPSALTKCSSMQRCTTVSKTKRKISLSR